MKLKHDWAGFHHIGLILLIAVFGVIGLVGWRVFSKTQEGSQLPSSLLDGSGSSEEKAIKAGKNLSNGKCEGTKKLTFTHLPMKEEDFSILIPYGLVVAGHVTPIDHQYFGPRDFKSPRDAYPVYAMADARITDIQLRQNGLNPANENYRHEYRFVFTHSCTSFYYYDLVTSLAGSVKQAYASDPKNIDLTVKAGELVGYIGGQTLDFAVWDTTKPLKGFIKPASYDGEAWKIYTADPYPFYTPQLRQLMIERNPRTIEPIAGKIDYDIDGKLIGNWFEKGTGGYRDFKNQAAEYWKSHIAVVPNHYDPSVFVISLGDFGGQAMQFVDSDNQPDPAGVGTESGLVKYSLFQFGYSRADGSPWDGNSPTKNPKILPQQRSHGCALFQLLETRSLKAENFPGQDCSKVGGFTGKARLYER